MGMDSGENSHTNRRVPVAKDGRDAFQKTESISRRRRWSEDEKARIVEESLAPGTRVCDVAKRHGISRGMVFEWRRQAKAGEPRQDAGRSSPAFVPVTIAPEKPGLQQIANDAPAIEIEMGAVRIHVNGRIDESALRTVLSAVQAIR
jgi:transposase